MKRGIAILIIVVAVGAFAQNAIQDKVNALSDQQLVGCLEHPERCPLRKVDGQQIGFAEYTNALAEHRNIDFLLSAYRHHPEVRDRITKALWTIGSDDPRVLRHMRTIAYRPTPGVESDERFFALAYLADRCDATALSILPKKTFTVACLESAPALESIKKCNYRPAAKTLNEIVRSNPMCLNIAEAALSALEQFYPGACPVKSLDDISSGRVSRCYDRVLKKQTGSTK